jgi:hypothetical protein
LELLLFLRVALGVARAGAQRAEAEPVQQVVDRLQRAEHAELDLQDASDVLAAQDADAVGLGRALAEALAQPVLLLGGERAVPAASRLVGQGVEAAVVVARHPGADLAVGEQDLGGDGRRGPAQEGQPHGAEAARDLGPGFGADQGGQLLGGVLRLDVQGGLLPGNRQHTPPKPPPEVISRELY